MADVLEQDGEHSRTPARVVTYARFLAVRVTREARLREPQGLAPARRALSEGEIAHRQRMLVYLRECAAR